MATSYQEAVEKTIIASEQLNQIVNGTATAEVVVEDGSKIPSIRKALIDNFYFKDPLPWQQGQTETVFNQLRKFTDGSWWYAPTATHNNPVLMGSTPVGDLLWKVFSWDRVIDSQESNRALIERSWAAAGYNVVSGSFQQSAVLQNSNDVVVNYGENFDVYKYTGTLPKIVLAGSTPQGDTSFVSVRNLTSKEYTSSNFVKSQYVKTGYTFSSGGLVMSSIEVVYNTSDGMWYKYLGNLPYSFNQGESIQNWQCVGELIGHPLNSAANFKVSVSQDNVNKWLNCGEPELVGLGNDVAIQITDTVTIPLNTNVYSTKFKFNGSTNNIVLMNEGSSFKGHVEGTGTLNKIERAFYPATDGASNVSIFAVIDKVTFGVHVQPLVSNISTDWKGIIKAKNIVGAVGISEGYGILLSPANNCSFEISGDSVARHLVYLSAGASNNDIKARSNSCGNVVVQLYSTVGQPPTKDNIVHVWSNNLSNPAGQSGQAICAVLLGNVLGNQIFINKCVQGDAAVKVEGDTGNDLYPNGNYVRLGDVTGQYNNPEVCLSIDSRNTVFDIGMWFASASFSGISFRKTAPFTETSEWITGEVRGLNMSLRGTTNIGIYGDVGLTVKIPYINISSTNAVKVNVDDSKRIGYSRKWVASYTVSVPSTSQASTNITLPFVPKTINTQVVNFSASNTPSVCWVDGALSANLTKTLYITNPSSPSQNVTVQITIEGD